MCPSLLACVWVFVSSAHFLCQDAEYCPDLNMCEYMPNVQWSTGSHHTSTNSQHLFGSRGVIVIVSIFYYSTSYSCDGEGRVRDCKLRVATLAT